MTHCEPTVPPPLLLPELPPDDPEELPLDDPEELPLDDPEELPPSPTPPQSVCPLDGPHPAKQRISAAKPDHVRRLIVSFIMPP
jgi:hypothetical protein